MPRDFFVPNTVGLTKIFSSWVELVIYQNLVILLRRSVCMWLVPFFKGNLHYMASISSCLLHFYLSRTSTKLLISNAESTLQQFATEWPESRKPSNYWCDRRSVSHCIQAKEWYVCVNGNRIHVDLCKSLIYWLTRQESIQGELYNKLPWTFVELRSL